jgi:hypothetical protein
MYHYADILLDIAQLNAEKGEAVVAGDVFTRLYDAVLCG